MTSKPFTKGQLFYFGVLATTVCIIQIPVVSGLNRVKELLLSNLFTIINSIILNCVIAEGGFGWNLYIRPLAGVVPNLLNLVSIHGFSGADGFQPLSK